MNLVRSDADVVITPDTTVEFTVRTRAESGNVSPPSNTVVLDHGLGC